MTVTETMPFDVDLAPLALDGGADDAARLQQAIDAAFYLPQRSGRQSSIAGSVAFLDRLTEGHERRHAFERMGWLDPALAQDPAGFMARAEQLVAALPGPRSGHRRLCWKGRGDRAG